MATKKKDALEAVEGTRGNVTKIADKLGLSRTQTYKLKKKWPCFADAIRQEKEKFKDLVETTIEDKILAGDTTLAIFYAKTQMYDRGYGKQDDAPQVQQITFSFDPRLAKVYKDDDED